MAEVGGWYVFQSRWEDDCGQEHLIQNVLERPGGPTISPNNPASDPSSQIQSDQ